MERHNQRRSSSWLRKQPLSLEDVPFSSFLPLLRKLLSSPKLAVLSFVKNKTFMKRIQLFMSMDSGYSQSMSIPSKSHFRANTMAESMNFFLLADVEDIPYFTIFALNMQEHPEFSSSKVPASNGDQCFQTRILFLQGINPTEEPLSCPTSGYVRLFNMTKKDLNKGCTDRMV